MVMVGWWTVGRWENNPMANTPPRHSDSPIEYNQRQSGVQSGWYLFASPQSTVDGDGGSAGGG